MGAAHVDHLVVHCFLVGDLFVRVFVIGVTHACRLPIVGADAMLLWLWFVWFFAVWVVAAKRVAGWVIGDVFDIVAAVICILIVVVGVGK